MGEEIKKWMKIYVEGLRLLAGRRLLHCIELSLGRAARGRCRANTLPHVIYSSLPFIPVNLTYLLRSAHFNERGIKTMGSWVFFLRQNVKDSEDVEMCVSLTVLHTWLLGYTAADTVFVVFHNSTIFRTGILVNYFTYD